MSAFFGGEPDPRNLPDRTDHSSWGQSLTVPDLLCVCGKPVRVNDSTCGSALCIAAFDRFLECLTQGPRLSDIPTHDGRMAEIRRRYDHFSEGVR